MCESLNGVGDGNAQVTLCTLMKQSKNEIIK